MRKQIEEYVLSQDFEKHDLTKRVTELIKFIPYTKHLLKKLLDVESLLKQSGELEMAKRVQKRLVLGDDGHLIKKREHNH